MSVGPNEKKYERLDMVKETEEKDYSVSRPPVFVATVGHVEGPT